MTVITYSFPGTIDMALFQIESFKVAEGGLRHNSAKRKVASSESCRTLFNAIRYSFLAMIPVIH